MRVEIEQDRLSEEIETLASYSADASPSVTRVVFSKQDMAARRWMKRLCEESGLLVREDAVGNTFARWVGSKSELPAVATGSHIDAIPHAGKYDGVVGTLGGLEAIRALQRIGFVPARSIELLMFTAEEPTRFGIGCLGSRLLTQSLDASIDTSLRDADGHTLQQLRYEAGFSGPLETVRLKENYYSAFVELHIEQGPILEREGIPLGIVTDIAAPASLRIHVEGEGGHAGGHLMPGRRDALCAAAEIVLAVESAALTSGAMDTVATVGVCQVHPGAVNSIPSRVALTVDIRDIDEARRNLVEEHIRSASNTISEKRLVTVTIERVNADPPAHCSPTVVNALFDACEIEKLPSRSMISRAYHDSLFMARIAPVGMLFIPCRNGVSHRPDEFSSPQDIARGVLVLARTLITLSQAT